MEPIYTYYVICLFLFFLPTPKVTYPKQIQSNGA
jgi:hypothetical protein